MCTFVLITAAVLAAVETFQSEPVAAGSPVQPLVTYQAMVQGDYLVVRARHAEGWHTYAMDNDLRAEQKLAGKPSLGVELPTECDVEGITLEGAWLQTDPEDLSMPELRWYRWGYSGDVWFAAKIQPQTPIRDATVSIRGQVCNDQHCRSVNVRLSLIGSGQSEMDPCPLETLVETMPRASGSSTGQP